MSRKLNDFGEKIGGAKKDLWKTNGLGLDDLSEMTETERQAYVTRDMIWPKKKNIETFLDYWKDEIRSCIYPHPREMVSHKEYLNTIQKIRGFVDSVGSEDEISSFYRKMKNGIMLNPAGFHTYSYVVSGVFSGNRFLKNSRDLDGLRKRWADRSMTTEQKLERDFPVVRTDDVETDPSRITIRQSGSTSYYYSFGNVDLTDLDEYVLLSVDAHAVLYTGSKEECRKFRAMVDAGKKERKKKKDKWIPPQLAHISREGPERRKWSVSGKTFMKTFSIRAGEFGNWTNENDRRESMNMAFDAFYDLADALDIDTHCIGLKGLENGALAIAFGSRGHGSAVAHYEPLREVINLTKMKGAGSLAHEFGHALDDYIGKTYMGVSMASEAKRDLPSFFARLKKDLFYKPDGSKTDYYINSRKFAAVHSKEAHGYWDSPCEMLARAFACYIKDKCGEKQIRSDYLTGHAEAAFQDDVKAFPTGDERTVLNRDFDDVIEHLVQDGLFYRPAPKTERVVEHADVHFDFTEDDDGQLSLF